MCLEVFCPCRGTLLSERRDSGPAQGCGLHQTASPGRAGRGRARQRLGDNLVGREVPFSGSAQSLPKRGRGGVSGGC